MCVCVCVCSRLPRAPFSFEDKKPEQHSSTQSPYSSLACTHTHKHTQVGVFSTGRIRGEQCRSHSHAALREAMRSVFLSVGGFLACDIHHAVPFLSLTHTHTRSQYQHRHLHRTKQRVSGHRLGSAPSAVAPQQAEQGVGCPVQAPPPLGRSHGPPRLLSSRRPRRVCGAGAPPLVDAVSSLSLSLPFSSSSLSHTHSLPASSLALFLSLSFLFLSLLSSLTSLSLRFLLLPLSLYLALPPSFLDELAREKGKCGSRNCGVAAQPCLQLALGRPTHRLRGYGCLRPSAWGLKFRLSIPRASHDRLMMTSFMIYSYRAVGG